MVDLANFTQQLIILILLQVGLNYLDTREALCNSVELIITKTAVCEYYATIFTGLLSERNSSLHTSLVKELHEALPTFYERVLVFTLKVHEYFTSRKRSSFYPPRVR